MRSDSHDLPDPREPKQANKPSERSAPSPIVFYFDFISPYSFLAIERIARSPELSSLSMAYEPVSFGMMLGRRGVLGPGEIPERRRRGLEDVLLLARFYGIPLEGPPTHPFNSLYATRSVLDVADHGQRAALSLAYFRAAWGEGKSLEDLDVLRACLKQVGLEQDPDEAASRPQNRRALKQNTEDALKLGAHGVPTFVVDDLVFFGHDRLELLLAYIEGRTELDRKKLGQLLERPQPGRIV